MCVAGAQQRAGFDRGRRSQLYAASRGRGNDPGGRRLCAQQVACCYRQNEESLERTWLQPARLLSERLKDLVCSGDIKRGHDVCGNGGGGGRGGGWGGEWLSAAAKLLPCWASSSTPPAARTSSLLRRGGGGDGGTLREGHAQLQQLGEGGGKVVEELWPGGAAGGWGWGAEARGWGGKEQAGGGSQRASAPGAINNQRVQPPCHTARPPAPSARPWHTSARTS